jgi:iron complex outermembrane receptor protein
LGARDAAIALILALPFLFPAALGASPDGARADSALGDTVLVLPEVQVVRERPSAAQRRLPTAFVTELRLDASPRALATLSETLSEAAGVHVQQYGGLGSFSVVSLRGAPSGQVAIYLDGAPLTSAANGVVNLADLPVTAIERIEIYRGASPLGLGAPGAGGTVNLVTLAGATTREARVTRGSFQTWEGRLSGAGRRGTVSGLAHLGYQGSAGDFRYLDDNGTPFNLADDATSTRRNNRFDATTGLASVTWRPRDGARLTARADLFGKTQGVPGLGAAQAEGTRLSFRRGLGQLEAEVLGRGARPGLTLRAGVDRERTRFQDHDAHLGLGRHDTDDRMAGDHLGVELGWSSWLPGAAFEIGGTLRREEARLHDALSGYADPDPSRRDSRGVSLSFQVRPAGGPLLLHAARRWDALEDRLRSRGGGGAELRTDARRTLDAPQLGARWLAGGGVEVKANWFRAQRPPDFLELFGNQGSVVGNPSLEPERVQGWDGGLSWSGPAGSPVRASATWAHFESRARDLILYGRNSQSSVRAENASRALVRGEELSLRLARGAVGVTGSGTWQTAIDRSDAPAYRGKRLPQRPAREGHVRLDWTGTRLGASADVQMLGDNYLDRYNQQHVNRRAWLGASVSFTPATPPLRLMVEGKNLGDRQAADVAGFPLPGRSVFVSCEARLGGSHPAHP